MRVTDRIKDGPWDYDYLVPESWIKVLAEISDRLDRVMMGTSPFLDRGTIFECKAFKVHAYSRTKIQPWNFKWRDVEISWYKHFRKAAISNQPLSDDRLPQLINECINAISEYDKKKV